MLPSIDSNVNSHLNSKKNKSSSLSLQTILHRFMNAFRLNFKTKIVLSNSYYSVHISSVIKYTTNLLNTMKNNKAWLAMCHRKLQVAMCGSKLRCARANPFFWNLQCACVRYIFRLAMCDHNFARFEEKKCPF